MVYYLHGDHLGSTSLVTNGAGEVVAQQLYTPYGAPRWITGTLPTDFTYTGQRADAGTGLMYFRARYYAAGLGRFISADSIVPGAASGAGGGAATLGYDPKTRLTPLTVNLGEFAPQIGEENREIAQYGWFFQWDEKVREEHNVPMGPVNPQALNRYAYALNNPLRYLDPTGHWYSQYIVSQGDWNQYALEIQFRVSELTMEYNKAQIKWGAIGAGVGGVGGFVGGLLGTRTIIGGGVFAFLGGAGGTAIGLSIAYKYAGGETIAELNLAMTYISKSFKGNPFLQLYIDKSKDGTVYICAYDYPYTYSITKGIRIHAEAANELFAILGIDANTGKVNTGSKLRPESSIQ